MKSDSPEPRTIVPTKKTSFQARNADILRDFKELKDILFEARGCYKLWWVYLQAINDADWFPTVLMFKDFFQTSAYSYNCNLIISLHKLYDGGRNVLNMQNFLKELLRRGITDDADRASIEPLLKEAVAIWKQVVILRSNLFAHRTYNLTKNDIYKKAKITPNQMRDLGDVSLRILNIVAPKLHERTEKFRDQEVVDMQRILAILKHP